MIDTEKLLKQLRRNLRGDYITICQSADRIESLQAENERLRAVVSRVEQTAVLWNPTANEAQMKKWLFFVCGTSEVADDPTTFTHVEDAHGYEVAVEFREGPSSSGACLYSILGKHKSIFGGTTSPAGEQLWFRLDGTCPGYPYIHLIRKDT